MLMHTTAVNTRMADRAQAAEQLRLSSAKAQLQHQLRASSLPGGKGDALQVWKRHDKEGKQALSLEQFSAAIRRDGKLGKAQMSEREVSQLFASLDTEKAGVVRIEKLGALGGGSGTKRMPLGQVEGNGTPTPRDRQHKRSGKAGGKVGGKSKSGRAKLSKQQPVAAQPKPSVTVQGVEDALPMLGGDGGPMAMLAAAEATVIAREEQVSTSSTGSTGSAYDSEEEDCAAPTLSLLPTRRSISCIPRKPQRIAHTHSGETAAPAPAPEELDDTPPVSPVDESPAKTVTAPASESAAADSAPEPWSSAEHQRFEVALEIQGRSDSPPADAWSAIATQVGTNRTVDEVKAYGMQYLERLSQADQELSPEPRIGAAIPPPASLKKPAEVVVEVAAATAVAADDAVQSTQGGVDWSQEERGRLAAALDILGPALLAPEGLRPGEASKVWELLAAAVGGGRTAWETRLFAAEWLVRGGGGAPTVAANTAANEAAAEQLAEQGEQLAEQGELIEELVAEHAECEAERREAVEKWTAKEELIAEIVEEHAGVEAERREALLRADDAEEELADAHKAARFVAIDVIARNLAATAIQAQWRKWTAAQLLHSQISQAVAQRMQWRKVVDARAAAQLARVVMSAEASQTSLASGLQEAKAELGPLRDAVIHAARRLKTEREQHHATQVALKHAMARAQLLEQRMTELSQTLSAAV